MKVEEFVKPTDETVALINEFLTANNIQAQTISPAGDWLSFAIPVSQANSLFDADFSLFQHEETGKQFTRTLSYSIPAELQGHLDLVHPTITFDNPFVHLPVVSSPLTSIAKAQNLTARQSVPSSCDSTITPTCLQDLYGIPATKATQKSKYIIIAHCLRFSP